MQSSRRVENRTVEIVPECVGGQIRLIRRAEKSGVLMLEVTNRIRMVAALVMEK